MTDEFFPRIACDPRKPKNYQQMFDYTYLLTRWLGWLFGVLVETVDGLSLQDDGDGDQGVVAGCRHGLEVAADSTVGPDVHWNEKLP